MDAEPRNQTPRLVWAAIITGAILRLIQFLANRSLWIDEARLSLNIAGRSYAGLMRPLDYDQAAPVPFLWLERLATRIGGVNEYALRILPLLAGILLPLVTWRLASRILPRSAAVLATALVALSPMLVRYSNEAKPYSVDALLAVLVLIAAVDLVAQPLERGRWWRLGAFGLIALLGSLPAIMTLAGAGIALLLAPEVRRERGGVARVVVLGGIWIAGFLGLYLAFYRTAAGGDFLNQFWEFAFLRPGARDLGARAWTALIGSVSGVLVGTLDEGRWGNWVVLGTIVQALAVVILALLGLFALARHRRWYLGALLIGPLIAVTLASALGRYPLTVRLLLFVVPSLFIATAAGIFLVVGWLPGAIRGPGIGVLALALLCPMVARGVLTSLQPIRLQDTRPVIAELVRERHGEAVYLYPAVAPAWVFYSTDWTAPDTARLRWFARSSSSGGAAFPSRPPRGHRVSGEGSALHYQGKGGLEILGVATGRPLRWGGADLGTPDPGWAENEAARIRAAAGGAAWVLFMPISPADREPNLGLLSRAIVAEGGTQELEFHRREADLFRYRFARGGT